MKKQTCCFTGHRKIPPEQYERIAQRLKAEITALIHRGVVYFEAGGAFFLEKPEQGRARAVRQSLPSLNRRGKREGERRRNGEG